MTAMPAQSRIPALDALRGLAVAGIAPMNVIAFALPAAAFYMPTAYGLGGERDAWLWAAIFVLDEDKFRAVFAMLFALGSAILFDKPQPHPLRAHYLRMLVLFVIGLAHALLLAGNDVLRLYALCGLLLPLVMRWRARTLLLAACAILALYVAALGWALAEWTAYFWCNFQAPGVEPPGMEPFARSFGAAPDQIARALIDGREALGERVLREAGRWPNQLVTAVAAFPPTFASMLVGLALWRNGLLAGRWERKRALRLGLVLLAVTLPLEIAMAALSLATGLAPLVTFTNAVVWSVPVDIAMGAGVAALAMVGFAGDGWLARRFAAAGRLALTNYLASSTLFAFVFAGWGLGLFGEVSRGAAYAVGFVPVALMLLWSPPWLARFRHGPAEWLWRSLAQGKALPFFR